MYTLKKKDVSFFFAPSAAPLRLFHLHYPAVLLSLMYESQHNFCCTSQYHFVIPHTGIFKLQQLLLGQFLHRLFQGPTWMHISNMREH